MKKILLIIIVMAIFGGGTNVYAAITGGNNVSTSTNSAKNSELNYNGSLVQCDGVVSENEPNRQTSCNFANLIKTVTYLINWAFALTVPVVIGLLAWAGLLHMTGREDKIKKSYKIMQNVVIGFALVLCAWFIVTTILKWVLKDTFLGTVESLVETQK